jgi:hypothetical protein
VKPALTPEQWANNETIYFRQPGRSDPTDAGYGIELANYRGAADGTLSIFDDSWAVPIEPHVRHGAAAFMLYGQPFGFTHDDVEKIDHMLLSEVMRPSQVSREFHGWMTSLRDRIAALLPPETKGTE